MEIPYTSKIITRFHAFDRQSCLSNAMNSCDAREARPNNQSIDFDGGGGPVRLVKAIRSVCRHLDDR